MSDPTTDLTAGARQKYSARKEYLLAWLRVRRKIYDDIGKLLGEGHIDVDTAIEMIVEARELY